MLFTISHSKRSVLLSGATSPIPLQSEMVFIWFIEKLEYQQEVPFLS